MTLSSELGQLNQGEEVKLHLRYSSRAVVPIVIVAFLLGLTIILLPLTILILLITVILYFSRIRSTQYFVTTDRVILYRKFLSKYRRDIYYENVNDFVISQGIWGRMLGYGSVQPITTGTAAQDIAIAIRQSQSKKGRGAGGVVSDRIINVQNPDNVHNILQSLRQAKMATKSPMITKEREVITREVLVQNCNHCGSRITGTPSFCPNCGGKLK